MDPIHQEASPQKTEPRRVPAGAVLTGTLGAALAMLGVILAFLFTVPVVQRRYALLGVALIAIGCALLLAAWAYGRRRRGESG